MLTSKRPAAVSLSRLRSTAPLFLQTVGDPLQHVGQLAAALLGDQYGHHQQRETFDAQAFLHIQQDGLERSSLLGLVDGAAQHSAERFRHIAADGGQRLGQRQSGSHLRGQSAHRSHELIAQLLAPLHQPSFQPLAEKVIRQHGRQNAYRDHVHPQADDHEGRNGANPAETQQAAQRPRIHAQTIHPLAEVGEVLAVDPIDKVRRTDDAESSGHADEDGAYQHQHPGNHRSPLRMKNAE